MTDTRTPFFIETTFVLVVSGISILAVVVFKVPPPWVAPCIAGGYFLGYVVAAVRGWRIFHRRIPPKKNSGLAKHGLRLVAISLPSAGLAAGIMWATIKPAIRVSFFANSPSSVVFPAQGMVFIGTVIALTLGLSVYLVLAKIFKIPEIAELQGLIRRKLRKEPAGDA
jgi:hypothetical protein